MDWAKTTARREGKHLCLGIGCDLYQRIGGSCLRVDIAGSTATMRVSTDQIHKIHLPCLTLTNELWGVYNGYFGSFDGVAL